MTKSQCLQSILNLQTTDYPTHSSKQCHQLLTIYPIEEMWLFGVGFFLLGFLGMPGVVFAGRCQAITYPMCQNVGYNLTLMPNIMGHEQQDEVEEEVS